MSTHRLYGASVTVPATARRGRGIRATESRCHVLWTDGETTHYPTAQVARWAD